MRHTRNPRLIGLLLSALALTPAVASAIPVYLKPESLFPSGHHPREFLERKTRETQLQTWVRITTASQIHGWTLASHVLTPLHFSKTAILQSRSPVRSNPSPETIPAATTTKDYPVKLLKTTDSWSLVTIDYDGKRHNYWVENKNLRLEAKAERRAYTRKKTALFAGRNHKSRIITQLGAISVVEPLRSFGDWLEVRYEGTQGFLPTKAVITSVRPQEAVTIKHTVLYQSPALDAPIVLRLNPYESVRVHEDKTLKLGKAYLRRNETVWWQIRDDITSAASSEDKTTTLTTHELFKRKIFDMASSPIISNLTFASAQGVFRTLDGKEWERLDDFKNENYPIVISKSGTIFIGPYRSEDHGTSFERFIRWDHLIATIRARWGGSTEKVKLLTLQPLDANGSTIQLLLDIGHPHTVKVISRDGGRTWHDQPAAL